jgi:deazaflavin-dependent oxidoreductase (nitroreductase family)
MKRLLLRSVMSLASTRGGAWFFITIAPHIDRLLMGMSGGRLNTGAGIAPLLLLETTGRKSGQRRTAPLLCVADGPRYVVIASKGGHPKHPDWYFNVTADPRVTVVTGGRRIACTAHEADGDERTRLWTLATDINPGFDTYQERAGRRIPVIVLTPAGAEHARSASV